MTRAPDPNTIPRDAVGDLRSLKLAGGNGLDGTFGEALAKRLLKTLLEWHENLFCLVSIQLLRAFSVSEKGEADKTDNQQYKVSHSDDLPPYRDSGQGNRYPQSGRPEWGSQSISGRRGRQPRIGKQRLEFIEGAMKADPTPNIFQGAAFDLEDLEG